MERPEQATPGLAQRVAELGQRCDGGELRGHLVGDECGHLVPASIEREGVQALAELLPAVELEDGMIRSRRRVERDAAAVDALRCIELRVGPAGDDDRRVDDLDVLERATGRVRAFGDGGEHDLAHVLRRADRMREDAVAGLAGEA